MKANRLCTLLSSFALACGVEATLEEQKAELVAECGTCVDPPPVVGQPATGGGAGVGTSTTAAATDAKANARISACAAAKVGVTAPACPDPANCAGTSTITCTYANESCPITGGFGTTPRDWVTACKLSKEPDAWKTANCNMRSGPAGKPSFALCTVDATATASTDCEPRSKTCASDQAETVGVGRAGLEAATDAEACAATHCDPTTDAKLASGRGTAIGTSTSAAAVTGIANAKADAQLNAAAKLVMPACASGCKPFGAVQITYVDLGSNCTWTGHASDPPDRDPADGIGDWWADACKRMANRSIHDRCDLPATATANPGAAWCFASARANGTQLCVDSNSMCMAVVATSAGMSGGR